MKSETEKTGTELPKGWRYVHPHEAIGGFVQKMLRRVVSPYENTGINEDIRMNAFEGLIFFEGIIERREVGNKLAISPLEHAIINLKMIYTWNIDGRSDDSDTIIEQLKRRMYETCFAFMNDENYQKGARRETGVVAA